MSALATAAVATEPLPNLRDDPNWRKQILGMTTPAVMQRYPREASLHRNIITKRGTGVSPAWRRFEAFLLDLGPAPGAEFDLRFVYADSFVYAPGQVQWVARNVPVAYKPRPAPLSEREYSQYTTVNGQPVTYSSFVNSACGTFKELAPVLNAGIAPDQILSQKEKAEKHINPEAPWLPLQPERREAIFAAYRLWHLQILPKFADAATPDFLFLYIALGQLMKAKGELEAINLFSKTSNAQRQKREDQPAWKRYCELIPKAQAALTSIPTYNAYSLFSDLDELHSRILVAEQRFRGVTPKKG